MTRVLFAAACALALPAAASAASFQLDIGGNRNVPTFLITNTSASDQIVSFNFTIGDPGFAFDFYEAVVAPDVATFAFDDLSFGRGGGSNDEGNTNPSLDITFTGFDAGERFQFGADVDTIPVRVGIQNFEEVFFGNGTADNAMVSVAFVSGAVIGLTLPESPVAEEGTFTFVGATTADVPLPASLPMLLAGLCGFGLAARLR